MTSSMRRRLDAFDFKDEDGLPEIAARKFNAKFEKPNDNAIAKYKLVAAVDQRNIFLKKVPENVVSDDLEEIGCDHDNGKNVKKDAMWFSYSKIVNNDFDKHSKDSYWSVSPLPSYEEKTILKNRISRNVFYDEEMKLPSPSAHVGQSVNALLDSPGSVELSDEDLSAERIEEYDAVSTSDSDSLEDDDIPNDHVSNGWSSGSEMEHMEESIVVTCDYIIYQGNYYSALLVLFSPAGIKISSSDECGTKRFFSIRWNIDDIVSVKCQWFSRELQRTDAGEDEGASAPVPYFPNFDQSFEEVVYPKDDPDAVTINKRDIDLLQPQTFLNDNIIDFYVKYLKNQIAPEDKQHFHFFNSFFFRKLADLDRDPSLAADGKAAFMRVRKWTRKVDIFDKDYIFIPVNFNRHWSLLVICHPGEVAGFKDEDLDKSPKVPCILHMDSIKGTHAGLKNLIQSYLWEEYIERQEEVSDDVSSKFLNLRFVPLELPQQENCFDCGLFLLHYLELFLAEAPVDFNPFNISKHSNFLNANWFPPLEASLKRTMLQKLIYELFDHHSRKVSLAAEHDKGLSSRLPKNVDDDNGMEYLSKGLDATVACQETFLDSHVGQGIGITILGSSSLRKSLHVKESGLVVRDFFNPTAPAGSQPSQFQSFDHTVAYDSALSPLEEDGDNSEHFAYHSDIEYGEIACDDSYAFGSFGNNVSGNLGISEQAGRNFRTLELTKLNPDNQNNAATVGVYLDGDDINIDQEMTIKQRSSPVQYIPCVTDGHDCGSSLQIEASACKGSDRLHTSAGESSCQGNMGEASSPAIDGSRKRVCKDFIDCDNTSGVVELFGVNVVDECQEQQALKKLRLAAPEEV